jgi:uncharacterized protein YoxC
VSTYETLVIVGMALWIVVAVCLLVAMVYTVILLRSTRQTGRRIMASTEGLQDQLQPVLRHAERASEDVQSIVSGLRTDASELGRTMRRASQSTARMIDLAEERVAEVSALLEVVQEEAEETFFSTASLLRGLRVGKRARGEGRVRRAIGNLGRGR